MQGTTNQPVQAPPLATNPLPAQPPQNPKCSINALQHKKKKKRKDVGESETRSYNLCYESEDDKVDSEEENEEEFDEEDDDESEEGEGNEDWLYELLVELYEAQEREKEDSNSEAEEETNIENEMKNMEVDDQHDKTFFIATLFNNKRVKEEIPAKCEDPGPCLVTCKIKHVIVRECLCDPGA
ncbi:hypothetical protein PIB30_033603 [Stylosanthes scabra]|uniref:Uncharacterized protein n=1 Tax=Stylosanthes scabra TaxID=79078 RepID=A0ABU6ZCL5_9FABA|nr:hypothetical protein [Stylosanthes scabra]